MEEIAAKLPPGFGFEWSGTSYEERLSGSQAPVLFALSLMVVFLCAGRAVRKLGHSASR